MKTRTPLTASEIEQRRRALRAMVAIAASTIDAQINSMVPTPVEKAQGNEPQALKKDDRPSFTERWNNLPGWAGSDAGRGSFPCAFLFWLPALCRYLTLLAAHGQLHPLRARQAIAA